MLADYVYVTAIHSINNDYPINSSMFIMLKELYQWLGDSNWTIQMVELRQSWGGDARDVMVIENDDDDGALERYHC